MLLQTKITTVFCLLSLCLFAQQGPGGIGNTNGSDMYLWLKADTGVTQSSGVSSWADQSGNGTNVTAPSFNQRPAYVASSSAYNNMPIIDFDGINGTSGDELNSSTFSDITDPSHTLFIVWDIETTSPVNESAIYSMSGSFGSGGFNFDTYNNNLWYYGQDNTTIESLTNYSNPVIFNAFRNSNNTLDIYRNESVIRSNHNLSSGSRSYDLGTRFRIGVNYLGESSKHLESNVAEIIHYKYTLNIAERIIVSNYLSAKYAIAITNDFYNEDNSANGNFDFDVVGIGQATNGSNSVSAQGTGALGLSNPSSLSNDEYLFIGHNNVSVTIDEESNLPSGLKNRLSRLWRASKRNDLGTVTVTMDLSFSANKANFTSSGLKLLVDDDTDFVTGTTVYNASSYNSSTGIAVFENVDISDNDYITIASNDATPYYFGTSGTGGGDPVDKGVAGFEGPGGIGSVDGGAMYMWLRPDTGVTSSSGEITAWADQSGYLHNGVSTYSLTPNSTNPEFGANQINNYDVLTLDGVADAMIFDINDFTDSSYDMYFVWKNNEAKEGNASLFSNSNGSNSGSLQISYSNDANFYIKSVGSGNISLGDYSFTESNNILGFSRNLDNTLDTYIDGVSQQTGTSLTNATNMAGFNNIKLGVNRGNGKFLGLDLAEVLMFNKNINETQKIILHNYLSAKYNISLSSNDKYSYDNGSGLFDHHLAGIGRETATDYNLDAKGTGPVRIKNASDLDVGEYMLWACDEINSTFSFNTLTSSNYVDRLTTKWRVDESGGSVGTVDVSFTASDLNITTDVSDGCVNYVLIIDNNSDFSSPSQQIEMTLSDGKISATGVDFADEDYFTLQLANTIVYDGSWNHPLASRSGSSAPNTSDDCFDLRVVSGSVTVNNDVEVNSVNVANSSVLAMATARTLTVTKGITLNTSGKLKMLGTAQLVQDPNGLITTNPNTGSGFYNQFTTPAKNVYSFSYISPSASNGTTYNFSTNIKDGRGSNALTITNDGANFVFDDVNSDGVQSASSTTLSEEWLHTYPSVASGFVLQSPSSNVATGLGFTIKEPGTTAQTYISKGIPNAGEYSFTVAENSVALLGNPYPSALNSDIFLTDNSSVDALYFYEDQSINHYSEDYQAGYAVYTLNGGGVAASSTAYNGGSFAGTITPEVNIPVGQGFFVSIEEDVPGATTTSVVFKNSQRVSAVLGNSSVFFKQNSLKNLEKNRDVLPSIRLGVEMEVNNNLYHRQIGVSFKEGNDLETFDFGYDAGLFDERGKDAFIEAGGKKYVLASASAISEETEIPIKVVLDEDKEVSFMLDDSEGVDEVYLKDNVEETTLPLKGNVITKTLTSGVYNDRFSLTFQQDEALSTKKINANKVNVQVYQKIITVSSDEYNITGLSIIDFTGKTIKTSNTNSINISGVSSNMIILKVESKQGVLIKKISI
ncbi:T9SS type A sorting domain-containing protein [Wenyingzhuangia aestuarii]|uniref:hypothetical protein n=1 Tax=Wenyingzhuangia aestuarii TaxID=1647582 RepID=UPI0014397EE0|nr:hypothetical protein [Wenyingzhuangia aestuarii]NJB82310.1 hypothetical protein [Wenyingzhuangia aestuarii]